MICRHSYLQDQVVKGQWQCWSQPMLPGRPDLPTWVPLQGGSLLLVPPASARQSCKLASAGWRWTDCSEQVWPLAEQLQATSQIPQSLKASPTQPHKLSQQAQPLMLCCALSCSPTTYGCLKPSTPLPS